MLCGAKTSHIRACLPWNAPIHQTRSARCSVKWSIRRFFLYLTETVVTARQHADVITRSIHGADRRSIRFAHVHQRSHQALYRSVATHSRCFTQKMHRALHVVQRALPSANPPRRRLNPFNMSTPEVAAKTSLKEYEAQWEEQWKNTIEPGQVCGRFPCWLLASCCSTPS